VLFERLSRPCIEEFPEGALKSNDDPVGFPRRSLFEPLHPAAPLKSDKDPLEDDKSMADLASAKSLSETP